MRDWLPSFADEMAKIAEDMTPDDVRRVSNAALVPAAAGLAGAGLAGVGEKAERRLAGSPRAIDTFLKLQKRMGAEDVVLNPTHRGPAEAVTRGGQKFVNVSARAAPGTVAHEMGHLTGKPVGGGRLYRAGAYAPALAIPGLAALSKLDPESTAAKAIPWLSALPSVPRVAEEARASIRGIRHLPKGGRLRSALNLGPAFLSYLGPAAIAPAVLETARRAKAKRSKTAEAFGHGQPGPDPASISGSEQHLMKERERRKERGSGNTIDNLRGELDQAAERETLGM